MLNYDDLLWTVSFPSFCLIAMWFSMDLALLVRSDGGRRRREAIRVSIAELERRDDVVSAMLRRSNKAVLRRAVVVVGGDFSRSPRMQCHAISLKKCGMFDEVALVGFDMGNSLNEALQPTNQNTGGIGGDGGEDEGDCIVDTSYLIPPFSPPSWLRVLFPLPQLYWTVVTLYRACACAVLFTWVLMRASLMVVNSRGQLVVTDLLLVQSPPAVPFLPVIKYIVRPCVLLFNLSMYYLFIVPASWMMRDALSEIRSGLKRQGEGQERKVEGEGSSYTARFVMCPALIVDWHNFGYTILRNDGRPSAAVWLYWFLESRFCFGMRNLTVSGAMQKVLLSMCDVGRSKGMDGADSAVRGAEKVVILYDVAASFFGPVPRIRFIQEVLLPATKSPRTESKEVMGGSSPPAWVMRAAASECSKSDADRSGLFMIAATSWTPDDDYSMVVDALVRLDRRLQEQQQRQQQQQQQQSGSAQSFLVRPIWLLVTGKGASRERFEQAVTAAQLSPLVTVTTIYFQSYLHYAMALGAADVGLCMHHSSSGLDLPMKAVDMLGSGLPVVALRYDALAELLDDNCSWMFSDAEELEEIIWQHLLSHTESLEEKRLYVMQSRGKTWDDNWRSVLLPLLEELL